MSMEISNASMRSYIYNPTELRGELQAKGLESAQIEGVLRELDGGSIDTLKSLGLSGSVASFSVKTRMPLVPFVIAALVS